jgi:hypothetical protein
VKDGKPDEGPQLLRLRGLALRAARYDPGVTIPETVPVLLSFNSPMSIGIAWLHSDGEGIRADVTLSLEDTFGDFARKADPSQAVAEALPGYFGSR